MSGARIALYLVLSCLAGLLIGFVLASTPGPSCTSAQGHIDIIVNEGTIFTLLEYPEYQFATVSDVVELDDDSKLVRAAKEGQLAEVCFANMNHPDERAVMMVRGRIVSEATVIP